MKKRTDNPKSMSFIHTERGDYGHLNKVVLRKTPYYCCSFIKIIQGAPIMCSSFEPTLTRALEIMEQMGYRQMKNPSSEGQS